ncbi:hypothetical protein GCG54_00012496 [Colletotrichum gloeosporioides]|uniref:Uncharacterized protein n=1 Tax=Colletotrichum gloeosporioides TaxID=474922 RepID=A0A8H4FH94_COLGL|nr:uncharacterized protein GCG54_00012496 [Colletotrichum gloeosporioides]KAF3802248.1 hypothetical protein GCG54_00012496 [Colletotrichum gloeosporioides]
MASSPLQRVPLHVVAIILAHLPSIQQLGLAILSHRIFHDALKDNIHSVVRGIIANQIPDITLPFALPLLGSTKINGDAEDSIHSLLKDLTWSVSEPRRAVAALTGLSLDDYAFLSKNHEAVKSLRDGFAREAIPAFVERFELEHAGHLNPQETFRLDRAFYRYQIMCNLYCGRKGSEREYSPYFGHRHPFYTEFSPWVNEQLVCVYHYLENNVITAYDELAAHDVVWGELPVQWRRDPQELDRVQSYLCNGLPFLVSVINAKAYEERLKLLDLLDFELVDGDYQPFQQLYLTAVADDYYDQEDLFFLNVADEAELSLIYQRGRLDEIAGPMDGPQDSLSSTPFRVWLAMHWTDGIWSTNFNSLDQGFWECGYVMWDVNELPETRLRGRSSAIRRVGPSTQRLGASWTDEDVQRSERQRTDLWLAGADGYWLREGYDFSRITGLSEEKKQALVEKWKTETYDRMKD